MRNRRGRTVSSYRNGVCGCPDWGHQLPHEDGKRRRLVMRKIRRSRGSHHTLYAGAHAVDRIGIVGVLSHFEDAQKSRKMGARRVSHCSDAAPIYAKRLGVIADEANRALDVFDRRGVTKSRAVAMIHHKQRIAHI